MLRIAKETKIMYYYMILTIGLIAVARVWSPPCVSTHTHTVATASIQQYRLSCINTITQQRKYYAAASLFSRCRFLENACNKFLPL